MSAADLHIMARPVKNYCDYYPHQRDMRNHKKVKALRNKFGITGYALWSMFLEYLTGSDGNEFENSEIELELMSGDFGVSVTEISDVLNYCIKLELLFVKNNFVYSPSLDEYLAPVYEKRNQAKQESAKQQRANGRFCGRNSDTTVNTVTEIPQLNNTEVDNTEDNPNGLLATPPKQKEDFTPEQHKQYKNFLAWIAKHTPEINKLPKPITIKEFLILSGQVKNSSGQLMQISGIEIKEILEKIENNKVYLKKYRSPYLCITHWTKNNRVKQSA